MIPLALATAVAPRLLLPSLLVLASIGAGRAIVGGLHYLDMRAFRPGKRR